MKDCLRRNLDCGEIGHGYECQIPYGACYISLPDCLAGSKEVFRKGDRKLKQGGQPLMHGSQGYSCEEALSPKSWLFCQGWEEGKKLSCHELYNVPEVVGCARLALGG